MSKANESLQVDPAELRVAADRLDGQANSFVEKHQGAHARAGGTALGSGQAATALPQMLAAWEEQGLRFGEHFARHAEGHRQAATGYEKTDETAAAGIDDAGSEL
ncbi:ESX-1 secretion-associated protein [Mycolicibacterium houstonense]|uniref:ESX-1 secretion-associated protein n=1 Tax=Mycolicibacterium houstonense TaxID=146021 RepID=UPI003F967579